MRHSFEPVLQEETMSVLGVLENAEENWALNFVLILAERVDHGVELVVYLTRRFRNQIGECKLTRRVRTESSQCT